MLLVGLSGDPQVGIDLGDVARRGLLGCSGIENVGRTWLTAGMADLDLFGAGPCSGVCGELGSTVCA